MDVLPGALPEEFFRVASDDCLQALVPLVDIGIARKLKEYCANPEANVGITAIIERHFGPAIKHATFHQTLHDSGVVESLRTLNMDAISTLVDLAAIDKMIETFEVFRTNRAYIHSRLQPRSKEDFEYFKSLCPEQFLRGINVNRDYFYYPHAKEINTGLGSIISKEKEIDIAYKGLQARKMMIRSGGQRWEEVLRRV